MCDCPPALCESHMPQAVIGPEGRRRGTQDHSFMDGDGGGGACDAFMIRSTAPTGIGFVSAGSG